jgi:hypothetical protein
MSGLFGGMFGIARKIKTGNFWASLDILTDQSCYFQSGVENSRLCSVKIILEDSAAGGLRSCGTPSLAWPRISGIVYAVCMPIWSLYAKLGTRSNEVIKQ